MQPVTELLKRVNRSMIAVDLALGSGALLAPDATLRVLGHAAPSEDGRHLFRRSGPVWLTFATAHAVAAARGRPEDWWALSWLRATELLTDVVWARSPAVSRRGAKLGLRLAGVANLAMSTGFAALARQQPDPPRSASTRHGP